MTRFTVLYIWLYDDSDKVCSSYINNKTKSQPRVNMISYVWLREELAYVDILS